MNEKKAAFHSILEVIHVSKLLAIHLKTLQGQLGLICHVNILCSSLTIKIVAH
jgi:hypothetical protein